MKYLSILVLSLSMSAPAFADSAVNFLVELSGDNEVPPVVTDTYGTANLHVNQSLTEIRFKIDIRNAVDVLGVAGAHLHCAPAGANGPVAAFLAGSFPPGYDGHVQLRATLNDGSIINPVCGSNIAELVEAMLDGDVYINVHSTAFPAGVVRGQVQ